MCLAIPGEVVQVEERDGLPFAKVQFGGITRDVCLVCQPEARPGDFVLVHVGLAIARVDREEAARQWQILKELDQLGEVTEPPP